MFVLCFLGLMLAAGPYDDIPRLHWADPDHSPLTYEEYSAARGGVTPYEVELRYQSASKAALKLLIITNTTLYPQIQTTLNNAYIHELEHEGYSVTSITASGGTPQNLHDTIKSYYDSQNIAGVFLIGDLPTAWYHIDNDFGEGTPADFPCDLIYTALNATFIDGNADGKYESHTGDVRPVIYLGRLNAAQVAGFLVQTEAALVNTYLAKDVQYRTGGLVLDNKALSYIDDDWSAYWAEWCGNVQTAYSNTTKVYDQHTTWSDDYMDRWDDRYEHIMVCVHSSPTLHAFKRPGELWSNVGFNMIYIKKPTTHFYNLFACSNCNFLESNCMGSHYIFNPGEYGLVSIGSTKTGSMLNFGYFYTPLSQGENWGESLRQWFYSIGTTDESWFFGMTCIGDPTLVMGRYTDADLVELTAQPNARGMLLAWWGDEGVSYNLYRVSGDVRSHGLEREKLQSLNSSPIEGNRRRTFCDSSVEEGGIYTWYLAKLGSDGQESFVANVVEQMPQMPMRLAIGNACPNPANSTARFQLSLSESAATHLHIYDLSGRLLRDMALGQLSVGQTDAVWDLTDQAGAPVANGVYTIQLNAGGRIASTHVVVAR